MGKSILSLVYCRNHITYLHSKYGDCLFNVYYKRSKMHLPDFSKINYNERDCNIEQILKEVEYKYGKDTVYNVMNDIRLKDGKK